MTPTFKAPLPQARPMPQDRMMTPQDRGESPQMSMFHSPVSSKQMMQGAVRYVTVAIPADLEPTPENMARYFSPSASKHPSESPMTVITTGTNSVAPASSFRPQSPYGFVPISHETPRGGRPFSPPMSPYNYGHASPSPSVMSTMTTETFTSGKALDKMSPAFFPSVFRPPTPQDPNSTTAVTVAVRPKTPTGRKSYIGFTSPTNSTTTTSNTMSNLDDDSVRKSRMKTEMCMNYANNRPCPFGAHCTYAHGEEELQMTKLLDLHQAGLIDVDTYRTKPCLTWVATGSCPFGKRCCGIHDPRVSGSSSSWLPHTETQGNTMATDINVDCLHQKRLHSLLYRNPFGSQFCLSGNNDKSSAWSDLYRLICRIDYSQNKDEGEQGWITDKRRRGGLGPISKLQIALKLHGDADWQYKFRPQHIIHDELCMVLQKRAFLVGNNNNMGEAAREIVLSTYNPRHASHVLVREIAFGPDSDPTVRGVSLWFNVSEDEVQLCTPQQAKRFRWKRGLKIKDQEQKDSSSIFETLDSFPMIRPDDKDAFDLAKNIMEHRCAVLQTERLSSMRDRFQALKKLETQKKALQERFENQKKSWAAWAWPINVGRENVNKNTPVPPVDSKYSLERAEKEETPEDEDSDEEHCVGSAVTGIWESFLSVQSGDSNIEQCVAFGKNRSGKRLDVFEKLSQGEHLDADRRLPHISHHGVPQVGTNYPHGRQQGRCWKALLLTSDTVNENNEWEIVRGHFENSRSKKVLSIIQSPK